MNPILEKRQVEEMECGSNIAYILNDSSVFHPTEYKVLQSQPSSSFVKFMKMRFNGKVQLYYVTRSLKSMTSVIKAQVSPDKFLVIVANLLSNILNVQQNGFLSCCNVDISFDRIYVDPATYKVSLVYLPLKKRLYEEESHFLSDLRSGLIKLISAAPSLRSPRTMEFISDLRNSMLSVEDLYNRVKDIKGGAAGNPPEIQISGGRTKPAEAPGKARAVRLVALNAPNRLEIEVTKDSFKLGRNAAEVDGIISFNNKISRKHCQIDRQGSQWTITDLKSTHGTFVNGKPLAPHVPGILQNGDRVRLANIEFRVSIQ